MGMSTHIIGFRPPDEKWKKMKIIWDACEAADVTPPEEVLIFFDHEPPDDKGVEVAIEAKDWSDKDMSQGYEVDITKLPKGLTIIRFYNSW